MTKLRRSCGGCGGPVEARGTGLKTWHCLGGCAYYRWAETERRIDSGKEVERTGPRRLAPVFSVRVRRHIKVVTQ